MTCAESPAFRRARARARAEGERGAVMVEAAIAGFFFLICLFGVIEFGVTFFDYLTTSNMARVGARTGSTLGDSPATDYQILQAIAGATSSMPQGNIQFIVVYKASGVGAAPNSACFAGSVSNVCNRYTTANFNTPLSSMQCGATSPDRFWCPTSRKVGGGADSSTGPPDYVGVYIRTVHSNVTTLFGSSYTFNEQMVIRIEAQTP